MRILNVLVRICVVSCLLPLIASPTMAAALSFSQTGTGTSGQSISGRVIFEFVQHDFGSGAVNAAQITISNMAPVTLLRGNLITGVFFSLPVAVGNLSTASTGFNGVAATVALANGSSTSNVDIAPAINATATDGGYQLSNGPFGIANSSVDYSPFRYGISTVGGGLTGFNGGAVNSDDYGIFALGSSVTSGGLASARPLINTTAVFWVARPAAWTDLSQLGPRVRISYGSLPDNYLDAPQEVPETASLTMLSIAFAMAGCVWSWKRKDGGAKP